MRRQSGLVVEVAWLNSFLKLGASVALTERGYLTGFTTEGLIGTRIALVDQIGTLLDIHYLARFSEAGLIISF